MALRDRSGRGASIRLDPVVSGVVPTLSDPVLVVEVVCFLVPKGYFGMDRIGWTIRLSNLKETFSCEFVGFNARP